MQTPMQLVDAAHAAGRAFTLTLSRDEQRSAGQFMTPPAIARFMARRLVADFDNSCARVLEPAAGAGVLAAAVVEELLAKPNRPARIELLLYEMDARLLPMLHRLCAEIEVACERAQVGIETTVECRDFLLSGLALSGQPVDGLLTIGNPPFFKLNKASDLRAQMHAYAVYGQPNIYGLFMAACARLTPVNGKWCFITPRSWMNGQYFKATRQTLLRHLSIDSLHAFESRRDSFEDDAVLQETVIAWATGRDTRAAGDTILLTRSHGSVDLDATAIQTLPIERVVANDEHAMVTLPAPGADPLAALSDTLSSHGLKVSTGPVVAFRAAAHIRERNEPGAVPLLWLQHVGQQQISWPIRKKREYIKATSESAWMLVPNAPMVLMRRFSPKEDPRRVTCAAYSGELPGHLLGLENHLNYIHRPHGRMSLDEVRGLAAYLSCHQVDIHFRALAGSTQVNATELRKLPMPSLAVIEAIGRVVSPNASLSEIDRIVHGAMGAQSRLEIAA